MELHDFAFLKGNKIKLIPAELKHKRMAYDFGTYPEIAKWIFCEPDKEPVSYEQFDKDYVDFYFTGEELKKGRGYMICDEDMKIIGFISYSDYDINKHIYEMDLWLCCESVCGKGYGTDALATLSDYLLSIRDVNKLVIVPNKNNVRAIKSYKKAGYREISGNMLQKFLDADPDGKPLSKQK